MCRFFNKLILCLTLLFVSGLANAKPQPVSYVDLSKYAGAWYQISHVPLFFEGGVCACTRQLLTPTQQEGVIKVYNSCNDGSAEGRLRDISGEAYNDDPQSNAKFTVDFGMPWKGSYWIVGLDSQYRYAVVTDKDAYSLYILSKTPVLASDLYQEAIKIAEDQELKVKKLEMTEQTGCTYP